MFLLVTEMAVNSISPVFHTYVVLVVYPVTFLVILEIKLVCLKLKEN